MVECIHESLLYLFSPLSKHSKDAVYVFTALKTISGIPESTERRFKQINGLFPNKQYSVSVAMSYLLAFFFLRIKASSVRTYYQGRRNFNC